MVFLYVKRLTYRSTYVILAPKWEIFPGGIPAHPVTCGIPHHRQHQDEQAGILPECGIVGEASDCDIMPHSRRKRQRTPPFTGLALILFIPRKGMVME